MRMVLAVDVPLLILLFTAIMMDSVMVITMMMAIRIRCASRSSQE